MDEYSCLFFAGGIEDREGVEDLRELTGGSFFPSWILDACSFFSS